MGKHWIKVHVSAIGAVENEEVERMLGVSANKVGRTANEHRLKTPEYGVEVWDKAKYSAKQVPSWRYNGKAVERLRQLLNP